ncbi:hypothetical protein BDC45DRAFT_499695 [Circinella umbellata]|nr:hypothetical protein BDC45DRAFT_499695 [Circinella umbellata]
MLSKKLTRFEKSTLSSNGPILSLFLLPYLYSLLSFLFYYYSILLIILLYILHPYNGPFLLTFSPDYAHRVFIYFLLSISVLNENVCQGRCVQ